MSVLVSSTGEVRTSKGSWKLEVPARGQGIGMLIKVSEM